MIPFLPSTHAALPLLVAATASVMIGCDSKDPGVQAELIQLKAERAQFASRIQELESSIQSKNDEINALQSRLSENSNAESFDKQESMTRFIAKVTELKNAIQKEFPDAQLNDSVQMPAFDAPLQSEVRIDVRQSGQAGKSFVWTGRGKLTGEWEFSQRKEKEKASVSNTPTNNGNDAVTKASPSQAAERTQETNGKGENEKTTPKPKQPNDIPPGSRLVREDGSGKVWLTPDGRYIIKLNH